MSEQRFDRIEHRLDRLEAGQAELKSDVAGLKTNVAELKTDVAGLKVDVGSLKAGLADLDHREGLRYEQLRDDIRALSLPVPELERRWRADDAVVLDRVGRRLDPLEKAVKEGFGTGNR